jgi:hypothetical protein
MAVTPDKVQIGSSSDYLDGVAVDTAAGTGLFRETVVAADPEDGEALARVRNAEPAADDYGSVVRVAGGVVALNALTPVAYDEVSLSYTGANLTGVVYKQDSTTVATLTLGYTGDNLTSVVRT